MSTSPDTPVRAWQGSELIPFFRLEINRFVWWDTRQIEEMNRKAFDVRMFLGCWPQITDYRVLVLDHGEIEVDKFIVYYGLSESKHRLSPLWVTGTVCYFTTQEHLKAAGYNFNPHTWNPFIVKVYTDRESRERALVHLKGEDPVY